ncbi:MAG: arsenate reductase (glutaredoxin) [Saccharospirillaceae bacterium]|nr:arsenate reductase (glutaredoxin) [Pseudomonadales bacterium]NRB80802.1 arsenate reductase (glutaredoxin) [Saccharospirillaceae bacterium]
MTIIYHNPRCSKSRQTLALLEANNITPEIVLYLETPPTKSTLKKIIQQLNISPRELLRKGEESYKTNSLKNKELTDEQLIDFMLEFPKLIERPIVIHNNKAVLGRPPENVLEII